MGAFVNFFRQLPVVSFGALEIGIIWAVMALGVFIAFRVLDFADMTTDGSLTLGAAISGTCLALGINPWLSLIFAIIGGMGAGCITAALHTKLGIPSLISGIITQIGLYSVNLHIMGLSGGNGFAGFKNGLANIGLRNMRTVFDDFTNLFGLNGDNPRISTLSGIAVGILILTVVIAILTFFLKTEKGFAFQATGMNPKMIRALGVNTDNMIFMGLMISNALISLGGALVTQMQGFADISTGVGTIAFGLASVIIGEMLFGKRSLMWHMIAVVLGSAVYRLIIAIVMLAGLPPIDLKLATAILMVLFLSLPKIKAIFKPKR